MSPEERRKYKRDWMRAKRAGANKEWTALRRARENEARRKLRESPEYVAEQSRKRREKTLRDHGLSVQQYNRLLELQKSRCGVCGDPLQQPQVDHCHRSKKIRGLLCAHCNRGLGHFKDSPERLVLAVAYLQRAFA